MAKRYNLRTIRAMLGPTIAKQSFATAVKAERIPAPKTLPGSKTPTWTLDDVIKISGVYGFLKPPPSPVCVTVYAQKGGVLKTTLAFNLARIAALHNIKTCLVGIDPQGDATELCGLGFNEQEPNSLEELRTMPGPRTLTDVFNGTATLKGVVQETDLSTLRVIAESDNLIQLDAQLGAKRSARERWLNDVVWKLKRDYDLVVIDCPPTWNTTVSNAIVAADVLIVPLECRPGQYRGLPPFCDLLEEFVEDAGTNPEKIFVPTNLNATRKLSAAICAAYRQQLQGVTQEVIRESSHMEKANFAGESIIEFAPRSDAANRMRELLPEIFERLHKTAIHSHMKAS